MTTIEPALLLTFTRALRDTWVDLPDDSSQDDRFAAALSAVYDDLLVRVRGEVERVVLDAFLSNPPDNDEACRYIPDFISSLTSALIASRPAALSPSAATAHDADVAAAAWDAGYEAGDGDCRRTGGGRYGMDDLTPNPYRADRVESTEEPS